MGNGKGQGGYLAGLGKVGGASRYRGKTEAGQGRAEPDCLLD